MCAILCHRGLHINVNNNVQNYITIIYHCYNTPLFQEDVPSSV